MTELRKEIEKAAGSNFLKIEIDEIETICNTHADELAIGFVEYINKNTTQDNGIYRHIGLSKDLTILELMEMYEDSLNKH